MWDLGVDPGGVLVGSAAVRAGGALAVVAGETHHDAHSDGGSGIDGRPRGDPWRAAGAAVGHVSRCTSLFHLANAAMLPLAGVEITKRANTEASLIIAACILVPQFIVALVSPLAGRSAQRWGRRWVLLVGFSALPLRAGLLAMVADPLWIIPVQALDGLSGAAFGVITPLVVADISGRGGRFSLRIGILGLAIAAAATVSNTVAGAVASNLGTPTAFIALAFAGMCAVTMVGFAMPETRPVILEHRRGRRCQSGLKWAWNTTPIRSQRRGSLRQLPGASPLGVAVIVIGRRRIDVSWWCGCWITLPRLPVASRPGRGTAHRHVDGLHGSPWGCPGRASVSRCRSGSLPRCRLELSVDLGDRLQYHLGL